MAAVQEATSAQQSGAHREAALHFEQAYALSGGDPVLFYLAAGEKAKFGDAAGALADLEKVVGAGWPHVERFESDSTFLSLHNLDRWRTLVKDARDRYARFNLALRQELLDLAEQDQLNRAGIGAVIAEHGAGSPQADSAFAAMKALDEPLQKRLKQIIAEHAWPGRSVVADDGAHDLWLLVQHADSELQERVLPLLIAAAEAGEARKSDAAFLLDRVLMHRGEPQVYGTQLRFSEETGRPELHPIANPAEVDERRAEVLLEPLSEYLKPQGIEYPPPVRAARPQNPSPMVERTRAHERVPAEELSLTKIDRGVSLFIADSTGDDLLIHFMGAEYVPVHAVRASGSHDALAVVNLGSGSSAFERPYLEGGSFIRLVQAIENEIGRKIDRIDLSAFSAGYGAVRAILRQHADRVDGVLLLDGLHTGYVPEHTVLAEGGRLDTTLLAPFARFAERAVSGEKTFVLTHSEIFPGTFASTTETSDYLLEHIGIGRTPVLTWGPAGMQQLSEVREGNFIVLGFAGNTGPDHMDHLHGMAGFLPLLAP